MGARVQQRAIALDARLGRKLERRCVASQLRDHYFCEAACIAGSVGYTAGCIRGATAAAGSWREMASTATATAVIATTTAGATNAAVGGTAIAAG
jgi:hypothetical protein